LIFDVKPSIIGHRGFGSGEHGGYRENSVGSFQAAVEAGATWVELDARRSRDGELVVWHDPATPAGDPILSQTAGSLAAAGIVTLAEVLSDLPADVGVDIDVKTTLADATDPGDRRTHALIARALRDLRGTRRILVTSFDPSLPAYLAGHAILRGDVALGLLAEVGFSAGPAVSAAANLGLDAVCLHTASVGAQARRVADAAHQAELEVMVWTPAPVEAAELIRAGVDAVCVDDIPGVQAVLAGLGPAD
jgi:glycerophosphoryl diester phosphodiesterase